MTFLPAEVQEFEDVTAKRAIEPLFATSEWDFDIGIVLATTGRATRKNASPCSITS